MEWFKAIADFKEDEEDIWNADGSELIDLSAWKKKDLLEAHLETTYTNLSVGERKGVKKNIKRFLDELDEFVMQIGNRTFYDTPKDYRDDTIRNLDDLWKKGCQAYFKNKEGKAVYSLTKANKNPKAMNAAIKFGPWVIWKEDDWEDIQYNYKKWKRLQKRNKGADKNILPIAYPINQSQKERGRKDTRSMRSDDDKDKDKSRSRSRRSTSSRSRNKSKRRKTSSTSNHNSSSDGADSQASIV